MKFLAPLSLALAASVSAVPITFTSCATGSVVSVSTLDISPVPKAGATVTVTASGSASADIPGGSFDLEVSYLGIPVSSLKGDICSASAPVKLSCPVKAGDATVSGSLVIPKEAPKGKFDVTIKSLGTDGKTSLFCLKTQFTLAAEEVEEASYLRKN